MKMTKWIWLKSVNVTKNWQWRRFTLWTWPKSLLIFAITIHILCYFGHIQPRIFVVVVIFIELTIFSHIQHDMFFVVVLFLLFSDFWSNSIVIGHVQQLHVRRSQFLVKFPQWTLLSFGHIQPCLSVIFIQSS